MGLTINTVLTWIVNFLMITYNSYMGYRVSQNNPTGILIGAIVGILIIISANYRLKYATCDELILG